jgi:hypothetical protein
LYCSDQIIRFSGVPGITLIYGDNGTGNPPFCCHKGLLDKTNLFYPLTFQLRLKQVMSKTLFTYQRNNYLNEFRSKFTTEFETWFADLAKMLHSTGDIQSSRLTQGDGKIDAFVISQQLVYQCYAPAQFKTSEAAAKINRDFWGAVEFLNGNLKKWIFVHNHQTGQLDKLALRALNEVKQKCNDDGLSIEILAWGCEELWDELEQRAPYAKLRDLFGSPDPVNIDFATIEDLLLQLDRADYPIDINPVSQPSLQKLDFNQLSTAYRREIQEGRNGCGEVKDYFFSRAASHPEFAEQMAEQFRQRYEYLEKQGILTPDEIYEKLRLDAGIKSTPDAKREMTVRSILAFFFDSCDIFKNPD